MLPLRNDIAAREEPLIGGLGKAGHGIRIVDKHLGLCTLLGQWGRGGSDQLLYRGEGDSEGNYD